MELTDIPGRIPLPFASSAGGSYIQNPIPTASQVGITNGAASFTDGFPPLNFVPIASGGYPPRGKDFNGLLYQITDGLQWLQAGGPMPFNSTFSTAIGGYPSGSIIASSVTVGLLWISTADDNTSDPDAGGANWVAASIANARIRLGGDVTFYVAPGGNDSNSGLSSGSSFLTLQRAGTLIQNGYDLNGFTAAIRIAAGTYSAGVQINGVVPGATSPDSIVFQAIDGTVTVNGSGYCFAANQGSMFSLSGNGFVLGATLSGGVGSAIVVTGGAKIEINGVVNFGASEEYHVQASSGGQVVYSAVEQVSGGAEAHFNAHAGGLITAINVGVTLTGTPNFTTAYATSDLCGIIEATGYTITAGTATGSRYNTITNSVIDTGGGGANVFPGNSVGSAATGGQYV